jgi:hypothetical protein
MRPRHYSTKPLDISSWIESILYKRTPDGRAYLGIFLRSEPGTKPPAVPIALLYGPDIPSWLPGLVQAGAGHRSVGLAYNRLVKGRFPYQKVTGQDAIALKEMLS